jgi:hypothetical protein
VTGVQTCALPICVEDEAFVAEMKAEVSRIEKEAGTLLEETLAVVLKKIEKR